MARGRRREGDRGAGRARWRGTVALLLLLGVLGGWLPAARVARADGCVVINGNDGGPGSLRAALGNTDGFENCDAITFDFGPTPQPWVVELTSETLGIGRSVTLTGPGADKLTIRRSAAPATPEFRIFFLTAGDVAISGLTIAGGRVDGNGAGLAADNAATTLSLRDVVVTDNHAVYYGGGIAINYGARATIEDSTIDANTAYVGAGLIVWGGAVVTLRGSLVAGNSAYQSGGIDTAAAGVLDLIDSVITGNDSTSGGGGLNVNQSRVSIVGSTLSANRASYGGGMMAYYPESTVSMANTTITGNVGEDGGGGLLTVYGAVTLLNTTLADNPSGDGSQLWNYAAPIVARNTLIAGAGESCLIEDGGTLTDGGGNLDSGTTCGFSPASGSQAGVDPLLGPLADNGGPTPTRLPGPGSPAIDRGDNASCAAQGAGQPSGLDQRHIPRPQGLRCDVGAVEVAAVSAAPTLTGLATAVGSPPVAGPVVAGAPGAVTLTLDGTGFAEGYSIALIDGQTARNDGSIATTYVSPTRLLATLPAFPRDRAGTYIVTVLTTPPGGGSSNPLTLTVQHPAPTLTGVSPGGVAAGAGDTTLTLSGTGFAPGATVGFGGTTLTPLAMPAPTASSLTVIIPGALLADSRSVGVTVTNPAPGGGTSGVAPFAIGTAAPQPTVTASGRGAGTVTPAGATGYPAGSAATYRATADPGQVFVGWTLDGVYVGYTSPLTFTVGGDRTLVATFVARPTFADVPTSDPDHEAITFLAALGVINPQGVNGSGAFEPGREVQRAEVAAFVARVFDWDSEFHRNTFPDRCDPAGGACIDDELWNNVAALADYGVVGGYTDPATCASAGTVAPCYLPRDPVLRVQVASIVARAFTRTPDLRPTGFWERLPADPTLYTNVPDAGTQRSDLATYRANAGPIPDQASNATFPEPTGNATRRFVIRVLHQAFAAQYGTDRVP